MNMKQAIKWIAVIMALAMPMLSLMACSGNGKNGDDEAREFYFVCNGTELKAGADAAKVLEALGEANSQNELFDCGEGNSRVLYRYASFDLYTMKSGESEVIDQIELKDDLGQTDKGICIGAKESEVTASYGVPDRTTVGSITYISGNVELTFDLNDGTVSGIGLLRVTQ